MSCPQGALPVTVTATRAVIDGLTESSDSGLASEITFSPDPVELVAYGAVSIPFTFKPTSEGAPGIANCTNERAVVGGSVPV